MNKTIAFKEHVVGKTTIKATCIDDSDCLLTEGREYDIQLASKYDPLGGYFYTMFRSLKYHYAICINDCASVTKYKLDRFKFNKEDIIYHD